MRLYDYLAVGLLVASLSACHASSVAGPTDSPVAGSWAQREAVFGTSLVLALGVDGSTVSGTGTYAREGGRSGTVSVTGTFTGGVLRLAITYDDGTVAQFEGQAANDQELSGDLHLGPPESLTPAAAVRFDRQD